MKEIEVKILEVEPEEIGDKLRELGARLVFDGELSSIVFDTDDNALMLSNCVLRLRYDGETSILTYKHKVTRGTAKMADETEVVVSDFEDTRKILKHLGYREVGCYKKKRISYELESVNFDMDFIKGIPPYLEIESEDEKLIRKYVRLLGFKQSDAKNWTAKQLCEHYHVEYLGK